MSLNYTTLGNITNVTLQQFKDAYGLGNNIATTYYNELHNEAVSSSLTNVANYASLASLVTSDSGAWGEYANRYSADFAGLYGKNFAVGSDDWLEMQYNLMKNDLVARRDTSVIGELNADQTNTMHASALGSVGLEPQAFSLYEPLTLIADKEGSGAADSYFNSILSTPKDSLVDFVLTGFGVGIESATASPFTREDIPATAVWEATALRALYEEGEEGLGEITSDAWHDFQDWLSGITNDPSSYLEGVAERYAGLIGGSYGAIDSLPAFISALHTAFTNDLTYPQVSPLVLDLDGDGVELTSLTGGGAAPVYWDIDNDGFREASAWVKPDDGLLVRDLNSNGVIDNHSELFGTNTTNGFTALAALDSNSSGTITSADTNWSSLQVWKDTNQDGISQSGELFSLASLGITSISVSPSTVNYTLAGNPVTHEATFTMGGVSHSIVDAWFNYDNVNTVYQGDYTLNPEALLLPELRGYGVISDLTIAMSQDGDLLDKVADLAAIDVAADPTGALAAAQDALFTWAGVDGMDADDRGGSNNVDSRHVSVVESFFDQKMSTTLDGSFSFGPRSVNVDDVYRNLAEHL